MPARKMYFTFNKDVEINKESIKSLKEFITDSLDEEEIQKVKDAFCTEEFDKNFFKFLIKEIKGFNGVPIEGDYCSEKTKAIISIIYDAIGQEPSQPEGVLGLKYLYDEWDYEGCGHDDHYYLTFASEDKEIKKFTKEAEKAIEKLNSIGVKAKLVIEN